MKKIFKYFGIFLLATLILLIVISFFINLNSYKSNIIEQVKKQSGYDLALNGNIKVSFLPVLKIAAYDIDVQSSSLSNNDLNAHIDKISADISIFKLLYGAVFIKKLYLAYPKLTISSKTTPQLVKMSNFSHKNFIYLDKTTDFKTIADNIKRSLGNVVIKEGILKITKNNTEIFFMNKINFAANTQIPEHSAKIQLEFNILKDKITLKGHVNAFKQKVSLLVNFMNSYGQAEIIGDIDKNLLFKGKTKLWGDVAAQKYTLTAETIVTPQHLTLNKILINYAELNLTGKAEISFIPLKGSIDFLSDDTLKFNTSFVWQNDLDVLRSQIKLDIRNLVKLSKQLLLKISHASINDLLNQSLKIDTTVDFDTKNLINIKIIKLLTSLGMLKVTGDCSLQFKEKIPMLVYNLKIANPWEISNYLTKKLKIVNLQGYCSGNLQSLETDTKIYINNEILHVQGDLNDIDKSLNGDLNLNLYCKDFANYIALLAGESVYCIPVKNVNLFSKVKFNSKEIKVDIQKSDITFIDSYSNVKGEFLYAFKENKPNVDIKLEFDNINLAFLDKITRLPSKAQNHKKSLHQAPANSTKLSYIATPRWSKHKILTEWINNIAGDININIDTLRYKDINVEACHLDCKLKDSQFNIKNFTGNTKEGNFKLTGNIDFTAQTKGNLELKAEKIRYNVRQLGNNISAVIIGNINANLSFAGESIFDYINSLSGNIAVNQSQGVINGFNLEKISNNVRQLTNAKSFLGLVSNIFNGGSTNFTQLDVALTAEKGNFKIEKASLISGKSILDCSGNINLAAYECNILGNINLNQEDIPNFDFKINGLLDKPTFTVNLAHLQKYLIGKYASNTLKNLLNTKKNNTSDSNIQNKIGSLLQGLFA